MADIKRISVQQAYAKTKANQALLVLRVHFLRHLADAGGVAAEDTGNHFLLRLTRRSERCRSGSQISGAGLYERHGAKGRCRSVEGCWLFNGLKKGAS